jgi:PAS domain S-box-containing protein
MKNNNEIIGFTLMAQDVTEQRRTEELLRESEKRYREIFDSSWDALIVHDMISGTILDVNNTMLKMFGYADKEEALKCTMEDLSAVEEGYSIEKIRKNYQDTIDLESNSFEWRAKKKNGEIFWVQVSLRKVNIGGENRIMASVRDISERKNAEHQANKRMKELQAYYNLSEINEREGITLNELYQVFVNLLPQSFQYMEIACARIVINDNEFCTKNFKETAWVLTAPFKINGYTVGKIEVGYLEKRTELDEGPFTKEERLLIDAIAKRIGQIARRKQIEEELRESENILRTLADNLPSAVLFKMVGDVEGNRQFTYISDAVCRMNEVSVESVMSDANVLYSQILPEYLPGLKAVEEKAAHEGKIFHYEFLSCLPSGKIRWFEVSAFIRMLSESRAVSEGVLIDITERKRVEETLNDHNAELEQRVIERTAVVENQERKLYHLSKQLIRAEETERKRIAYILHTEVQQILVAAQIALKTGIKKVDNMELLECLTSVDQMLKEAQVETRELVHELVPPILLDGGLREAIIWLSNQIQVRHDFAVYVKSDDNFLDIDNDVSICAYQSIRELLLNVYKHANVREAEVVLNMIDDEWFNLTVRDKGDGFITTENTKSIVEFRNGFGLFDIRKQVEGLGGCMEIVSALGQGTSISLFLPIKKDKVRKMEAN